MRKPGTQASRGARLLGIILLIAFVTVVDTLGSSLFSLPTPLERLDLYLGDAALRLRGPQPPAAPIVIVTIDDESLNYTGYHWPWPRAYLAQIADLGPGRLVAQPFLKEDLTLKVAAPGIVYGAGDFSEGSRAMVASDTLTVTCTLTAAAA